jgi:hypothetical protein
MGAVMTPRPGALVFALWQYPGDSAAVRESDRRRREYDVLRHTLLIDGKVGISIVP